jgi:hypothetical protein
MENARIKDKGPWSAISALPGEIAKFQIKSFEDFDVTKKFDPKIPQAEKFDEVAADLNRKVGDFAIYGIMNPALFE